jgi:hypothetical protein
MRRMKTRYGCMREGMREEKIAVSNPADRVVEYHHAKNVGG